MRRTSKKKRYAAMLLTVLTVVLSLRAFAGTAYAEDTEAAENAGETTLGGGYAVTGQLGDMSYTAQIYDASNGLPSPEANYILGASDGMIWIGGYSGILRYDGSSFVRLDTADGLSNGRGLYEDSRGRIWVGTNDNGVVVLDGNESTHITYKDGLPSSSIRHFAEDKAGNVYIATTAGVCYADTELAVHLIEDARITEERVLKLGADAAGKIYGQTKSGCVFRIEGGAVTGFYDSEKLGMDKITTILVDPFQEGKLWFCTEGNVIYYGRFGDSADELNAVSVRPISNIHWISYDCGRVWLASTSQVGYLDESGRFRLVNGLPMNSGIEMMTSDYQGNMWFASSTQGVMKVVANRFIDLNGDTGLPAETTNAVCMHDGALYIGTDHGLRILNEEGKAIENELTEYISDARIRCIREGKDGELWIATFTKDLGLVCLSGDGQILSITEESGLPDNELRCISVQENGTVLAGGNGGLAVLRDGEVIRCIDAAAGIRNTTILTVETGIDGRIYAGTDGDGIYVIDGEEVQRIGREDGLTSDVIVRIIRDDARGLCWLITSNSIEYLKDGKITEVTSFPFGNNYDLYINDKEEAWILSSYGIYVVNAGDLLADTVSDYRVYTVANGLTGTPASYGYCAPGADGTLYLPLRSGVCKVNMSGFAEESIPLQVSLVSISCGELQILPDENGNYILPPADGMVTITAAVPDYTLLDPMVDVFLEGKEGEGIHVARSGLQPLEYMNLSYGSYDLHIRVSDRSGRNIYAEKVWHIVKKPKFLEMPLVRVLIFLAVILFAGFIVWRFLKSTIIRRQYDEIRAAKEEAERASSSKSRFLANMSHEIRTPINTIMGMNEMALREDATGVPKQYFMSMINYSLDIRNAAESLLSLINDLLDISRIESGKVHLVEQEYDTQEVLRSVVSMIRGSSTEKELTFDVDIDEMLPRRMYGDAGKIRQIVLNLLTNALKYTEHGGFILSVTMEEREDDTCKIRFSVKDTGIGIREEDMDKLFTAYERFDEQKNSGIQGTGLGLDISRRFAELMSGSLTCVSEYGKGSEFVLLLTQQIVDKQPIGAFREQEADGAKGPYVASFIAPDADILLVDDNPMNLNVIKGLLKSTKVFVSTASSGEECLEKIKDTRFDLVLLDHMMPGMDGVETLAEIRKTDPDLPVYALTANTTLGEDFYTKRGFTGFLSKPIDGRTLEKAIMKHLPEEMMEKHAADFAAEELKEMPPEMMWIYETEGINAEAGIRHSGGISNYLFSLGMFLDTIDVNAKVLRDSLEADNLRLYTIKVHSLKSSAKIIGAMELSELAAAMEEAGNREDKAFIEDNHDRLLMGYEKFKEKLSRIHPESEGGEMIPEKELKEAYDMLSDVIPQMDYDTVEMVLERLKPYTLPEEDAKNIREIAGMLKSFDWDAMEALIGKICEQRRKG